MLFVLWCLTPFSTIFKLYRGGQFYWWRKPEDPDKTTAVPQTLTNFITVDYYLNICCHQWRTGLPGYRDISRWAPK
jgi:hypothetical protein